MRQSYLMECLLIPGIRAFNKIFTSTQQPKNREEVFQYNLKAKFRFIRVFYKNLGTEGKYAKIALSGALTYSSLIFSFQGLGQGLVIDGAILSTTEGSSITVNGHLSNQGSFTNKGQLFLTGSMSNTGSFINDQGDLILIGEDQFLSSTEDDLSNLTLGPGTITNISSDMLLDGTINMNGGKIRIMEGVHVLLDSSMVLVGANERSYFIGNLYRMGRGEVFFPVGTDDEYLPVRLLEVDGINPVIGIEAFDQAPISEIGDDLVEISHERYWRMDRDERYSSGKIVLPYADEPFIESQDMLVVAQAADLTSPYHSLGVSDIKGGDFTGYLTSEGIANGEYFTIGYIGEDSKLPPLKVINVLTPYKDGKHDFLRIENIELYEDNVIEIFDRNGLKVFHLSNYDNQDRVFEGIANVGNRRDLEDGNYFYTIRKSGKNVSSGFLFLKR
ncbi:T9SS type B sorting domain-containing protein [Reichenbachiella ulvae]|uniref:Gliding motility-associated C-terminal domain-containing protein n=1 Tax=Reichenbachiella ulvae TaxID=2980104 RepID=A0ABT3CU46_9BACT|nr:gliding motility-associated C-terminal domain-containing protein [Reichenbachiella ulvae]MCV9387106.1 gliding motility-associated C-terminal domain-containing protein [Reichenbachiella ulvae]